MTLGAGQDGDGDERADEEDIEDDEDCIMLALSILMNPGSVMGQLTHSEQIGARALNSPLHEHSQ